MKSDDKLMKEISKRHNHYLAVCKKYSERIKAITKRFKKETGVCVRSKFDQVTKTRFYTCSKGLLIDLGSTYHSNIKNVWSFVYTRQIQEGDFEISGFLRRQAEGLGLRAEVGKDAKGQDYISFYGVCDEKLLPNIFDLAEVVNNTISSMQRNREPVLNYEI